MICATNQITLRRGGPLHRKRSPSPFRGGFPKEQGEKAPLKGELAREA